MALVVVLVLIGVWLPVGCEQEVPEDMRITEVVKETTPDGYGLSFRNCNKNVFHWGPRYDYDVVAWSPDGSAMYFTDGWDLYGVTADGSRLWLIATAAPPGWDPQRQIGGTAASFAVAPDGMHLVYASCRYPPAVFTRADGTEVLAVGGGFELVRITRDGGSVERLTANAGVDFYPAWSPDGRRIAFVSDDERADADVSATRVGLYTMAADGTDIRPVLDEDAAVLHHPPAWSPDGRHLAVVRYVEEKVGFVSRITDIRRQLYVVGADGAEPRRLATNVVSGPSWSPDGQRLAIAQAEDEDGEVGLYVIGIDGTGSRRVIGIEGWQAPNKYGLNVEEDPAEAWIDTVAWSPDGTQILVRSNATHVAFVVNAETGRRTDVGVVPGLLPKRAFEGVRAAAWSPDGSRIAMLARGDRWLGPDIVGTVAADGTAIRVLAKRGADGTLQAERAGHVPGSDVFPACRAGVAVPNRDTNFPLVADCDALFNIQRGLAGGSALNWSGERPVHAWDGVEVGGTPLRVQALNLAGRGLQGALPAALGRLGHLRTLSLSDNSLDGPISPELGRLSRLEVVDLSNNRLTGPIPTALGNLVNLRTLDLASNGLSGDIPPELGQLPDLEEVVLRGNRFTGCVPPQLPVRDPASLSLPTCEPAA